MANIPLVYLLSLNISLQSLESAVSITVLETSMYISEQPNIAIIGAVAFLHASKLLDSSKFQLYLCSLVIQSNFTKFTKVSDLSNILSEYHKFANVFSKIKAEVLAPHCPYDF